MCFPSDDEFNASNLEEYCHRSLSRDCSLLPGEKRRHFSKLAPKKDKIYNNKRSEQDKNTNFIQKNSSLFFFTVKKKSFLKIRLWDINREMIGNFDQSQIENFHKPHE